MLYEALPQGLQQPGTSIKNVDEGAHSNKWFPEVHSELEESCFNEPFSVFDALLWLHNTRQDEGNIQNLL